MAVRVGRFLIELRLISIKLKFDFDMTDGKHVAGWNRFVNEGLIEFDEAAQTNVKHDFPKMSKRFGIYYLTYLNAVYLACENVLDEEEFCKYNGNVPKEFIKRFTI